MNLYELFQKEFEESLSNAEKTKERELIASRIDSLSKKACEGIERLLSNREITSENAAQQLLQIKNVTEIELQKLEEDFKMTSKYIKMLLHIKDSGFSISNQKLCSLLKNITNGKWTEQIVMSTENGKTLLRLVFQNEDNVEQKVVAQATVVNSRKDCEETVEKMNKTNWFEEYLAAEKSSENERAYTLMSGQRCKMPKLIQEALEEAFKEYVVPAEILKEK